MKKDKVLSFDKLDRKLIAELPIISEVLTSTMNKVARHFEPYYEELFSLLSRELERHKYWRVYSPDRIVFYPFVSDNTSRKGITQLENEFWVFSKFTCIKKIKGKWRNYFWVEFGFCFIAEEGSAAKNFFFFNVYKDYTPDKYGGLLFEKDFYDRLGKRISNYKCVVWSPEEDEIEGIELRCHELDATALNSAYSRFKNDVLKHFLKHMKYN